MVKRLTAERQLARILELLPRASREEGVALADLARSMNVDAREIVRDLTEVYARAFYQPAGSGEDVQILIEGDHVTVWTTGEFRRPVRLSPRESLSLGLALRVLAAGADPERAEPLTRLAARLEERLLDPSAIVGSSHFDLHPAALAGGGAHDVIFDAARDRRRCRIQYLRSGATEPREREIDPFVLLAASGRWYIIAHCHESAAVRVFRMDRVLAATSLAAQFELPADFDPFDYVSNGRVFRAEEFQQVTVRYSARIARWIAEQGPVETLEDGSAIVRYSVAESSWLVRHVLEHGPDAEVLAPPGVRKEVAEALGRVLAGG